MDPVIVEVRGGQGGGRPSYGKSEGGRGLSYQISNGGGCEWEKSAREMIRS